MEIMQELQRDRHENLLFFQHRESGLRGALAIHDSCLGPAVGGVRCWDYATEKDLIHDALRLAENASLSAALYGCDAGGGKAVIWASPSALSETMLRALGIFIQSLGGRFVASPDLGTTPENMEHISKETRFVTGMYRRNGQNVNYASITARGVLLGMKAAAKVVFGDASLKGRTVAIQGLGKVGSALLDLLIAEEAVLHVSDLYFERVKAAKEKNSACIMVQPQDIPFLPVDIFAPCAMGDLLSAESVERLQCRIIAGGATNQLAHESSAQELHDRGILFVPDFLLNAGDIIMVNSEIYGIPPEHCLTTIEKVFGLVESLLTQSRANNEVPYQIAKKWALTRMRDTRTLKKLYRGRSPRGEA